MPRQENRVSPRLSEVRPLPPAHLPHRSPHEFPQLVPLQERDRRFPREIKQRVKYEQKEKCAYCGKHCRGHARQEPEMKIHHVVPHALGGESTRKNAVGLCEDTCHPRFDTLAFEEGKFFFEVLMEEGKVYEPFKGHKRQS